MYYFSINISQLFPEAPCIFKLVETDNSFIRDLLSTTVILRQKFWKTRTTINKREKSRLWGGGQCSKIE
jgi:hypothetical protein